MEKRLKVAHLHSGSKDNGRSVDEEMLFFGKRDSSATVKRPSDTKWPTTTTTEETQWAFEGGEGRVGGTVAPQLLCRRVSPNKASPSAVPLHSPTGGGRHRVALFFRNLVCGLALPFPSTIGGDEGSPQR